MLSYSSSSSFVCSIFTSDYLLGFYLLNFLFIFARFFKTIFLFQYYEWWWLLFSMTLFIVFACWKSLWFYYAAYQFSVILFERNDLMHRLFAFLYFFLLSFSFFSFFSFFLSFKLQFVSFVWLLIDLALNLKLI